MHYRDDETVAIRELVRQMYIAAPRRDMYVQLAHELVTATDLDAILANAAAHTARFMPLHSMALFLCQAKNQLIAVEATWGRDTLDTQTVFDVQKTAIGQALKEKHPIRYTKAQCRGVLPISTGVEPKALLCLPLIVADQDIGVLCLSKYEDSTVFSAEQQAVATSVADLLTLAIYGWLRDEQGCLTAFEQLSSVLDATVQPETAFEQLTKLVECEEHQLIECVCRFNGGGDA